MHTPCKPEVLVPGSHPCSSSTSTRVLTAALLGSNWEGQCMSGASVKYVIWSNKGSHQKYMEKASADKSSKQAKLKYVI